MRNNQSVLVIAGTALAALLGFALWMIFSSQPAVPPVYPQNSQEDVQEQSRTATPIPTPTSGESMKEDDQSSATTNDELQKIEAEFNSSVILDEDFNKLDGE